MKHSLLVAIAVVGCRGSTDERNTPAPTQPIEDIAAKNLREAALHATTHSVPRADWPCGATANGGKTTWIFDYGTLDTCTLPVTVHESAVIGCPTRIRIDVTDDAGETKTSETVYRYEAGHLVDEHITWKDGLAVAHDGDPFLYGGDGFGTLSDTFQSDWTVRDGKLVEVTGRTGVQSALPGMWVTTKLVWQGSRLLSLTHEASMGETGATNLGTLTLSYACKS